MSLEYMQSFIKIGGVVFWENASRETDGLLDLLLGWSNLYKIYIFEKLYNMYIHQ